MKKNLLVTAALIIAACSQTSAQSPARRNPFTAHHHLDALTQGILQHQYPAPAQRGSSVTDRLTGWNITTGGEIDSMYYKYNTTSRGSRLDNNVLGSYLENGFILNYNPQQPYPMAVSRNEPVSKFDTAYSQYTDNGTLMYRAFMSRAYNNNTIAKEFQRQENISNGTTYYTNMSSDFNYSSSGNLLSAMYSYDTSAARTGAFQLASAIFYQFSGSNVIKDSTVDYQSNQIPSETIDYSYDGTGNLTMAIRKISRGQGLETSNRDTYTYGNGKLKAHLKQYTNDGTTWLNDQADTFTFQGNNLTYQSTYSWDDSSNSWLEGYVTRGYYNAQNNLDSQVNFVVTAGVSEKDSKLQYSYNSFNHYSKVVNYNFDGTAYSATPDAQLDLYYETYTPTAISTPKLASGDVSIYPNPATDKLNIRFKDAAQGSVVIRIYNIAGQLLQQTSSSAASSIQIPVSDLTPGSYMVEVADNQTTQHLTFIKQ